MSDESIPQPLDFDPDDPAHRFGMRHLAQFILEGSTQHATVEVASRVARRLALAYLALDARVPMPGTLKRPGDPEAPDEPAPRPEDRYP